MLIYVTPNYTSCYEGREKKKTSSDILILLISARIWTSKSILTNVRLKKERCILRKNNLLNLSFSSFTFLKRLFSSSSLSAIKVMSSAYLRLSIFLPAILIPACASSSTVFLMMYSAYKLNKQGDYIQPWHIPFPVWNQSVVPCPVLTVASWPVYRFLKRKVRWSGISISFRIFHTLLWSTQSKALA